MLAVVVALVLSLLSQPCVGLAPPVRAEIAAGYAPISRYEGHWGIDYHVPAGTTVTASADGWVSFSGTVAGNRTVTVDHGGGLRTSYSFLDEIWVGRGAAVGRSTTVGTAGPMHGGVTRGVHFSTRVDGVYVDPVGLLGCPAYSLPDGLRLVPVPTGHA